MDKVILLDLIFRGVMAAGTLLSPRWRLDGSPARLRLGGRRDGEKVRSGLPADPWPPAT
jgi:hypothetical protein